MAGLWFMFTLAFCTYQGWQSPSSLLLLIGDGFEPISLVSGVSWPLSLQEVMMSASWASPLGRLLSCLEGLTFS